MLEKILDDLKRRFDSGHNLKVQWEPRTASDLDGEVKGSTIFIYTTDLKSAKTTLRHEFLELIVEPHTQQLQRLVNDQRLIINTLLAERQKEAYREREKIVETILGGLDS